MWFGLVCGCAVRCAVAALPHRNQPPLLLRDAPRPWGAAPNSTRPFRKGTAFPHIGRQSRKPLTLQLVLSFPRVDNRGAYSTVGKLANAILWMLSERERN